jgi:DNA-binding FadR family transcriptional regulator
MFTPLKRTSIAYEIITHFRYLIRSGAIKIGDRLPDERRMAEELCVSRSSLREAMKILAFNKIVEVRPGCGTFLRASPLQLTEQMNGQGSTDAFTQDPAAFVRTLEIRMMIEPPTARLAATYITDEELAELDAIVERMSGMLSPTLAGGYAMEDLNFHYTYPKAARNPLLHKMICDYSIAGGHHAVLFGQVPHLEEGSFVQHKAIVEAFRRRDPDAAEHLLREHIYFAFRMNLHYIHEFGSRERLDAIVGRAGHLRVALPEEISRLLEEMPASTSHAASNAR